MADINTTPEIGIPATATTERLSVPAKAVFPDLESLTDTTAATAAEAPMANESTAASGAPAQRTNEPATPATPSGNESAQPSAAPAARPEGSQAATVKVAGKEYTVAELEKALADRSRQNQPAPAPAAAAQSAPAPRPPSAEQIAGMETDWRSRFAAQEKLNFAPTEDEMETLLSGGKEAVVLFGQKMNDLAAHTVMLARKSLWADSLNPILNRLQGLEGNLQPVFRNAQEVEAAAAEHQFFGAYPEFASHRETVQQVGQALISRYPEQFFQLSREQQLAEVAAQTDRILQNEFRRWNPGATGTWRDAGRTAPAAAQSGAQAARPAPAKVQAPAANSPAANPASTATDKNWHKQVAASLVG